ncbi:MAG: hypothetical protein ACOY9D_09270 [Pseudomonadota bacterium]
MNIKNSGIALAWLIATLLLAACGGGGGGSSGPVASTLSFPLLSGYKTFTATGEARNFIVSGDCSGSGSTTTAPATTPATFESVTGFSAATTLIWSLTNCIPASYADTTIEYYDSNYLPLGYDDTAGGGDYAVYLVPVAIPSSVKVGDTGIIGTQTKYTSSLKTTLSGTVDFSYAIQADTADTAIVISFQNIMTV